STTTRTFSTYAAIPIYGRGADNIRDHRNVTSMLHRIKTTDAGVFVCPTMTFDERGHLPNHQIYYVGSFTGDGATPQSFYPTVDSLLGEGDTYILTSAVYENLAGVSKKKKVRGTETMGAFSVNDCVLANAEQINYIILLGIGEDESSIHTIFEQYNQKEKVLTALSKTKQYWNDKVNVSFHTKDTDFDNFMKWVSFQPFLRRLFGCSFLPHHDYGRGGRGWRDLWQDCLSLLLMNPQDVGQMIEKNFGGVRIDGTNATIIGEGDGNFIADRNGIARVWMDHALWPQMTVKLYIDQTGDVAVLDRQAPYFKDAQAMRGTRIDPDYQPGQGCWQRTADG